MSMKQSLNNSAINKDTESSEEEADIEVFQSSKSESKKQNKEEMEFEAQDSEQRLLEYSRNSSKLATAKKGPLIQCCGGCRFITLLGIFIFITQLSVAIAFGYMAFIY